MNNKEIGSCPEREDVTTKIRACLHLITSNDRNSLSELFKHQFILKHQVRLKHGMINKKGA